MLKNHIKIAWRNLLRDKGFTLINVGGLALGLALTVLIGLWINDEFSHNDYFLQKDRIAQVYRNVTQNGNTSTNAFMPAPLEHRFREDFGDNFEHVVMSSWNMQQYLEYNGSKIARNGNFMQSTAPQLLNLNIIKGEKDGLREVNSIMLNASSASALFGNENPIGRVIRVDNRYDMMVTAIYEDIPFNTSFNELTFLMPWKHYASNNNWVRDSSDNWGRNSFKLFVQIAENTTMQAVTTAIKDVIKDVDEDFEAFNPQLFLLPMKDWHLRSYFEQGQQVGGRITYVWLFGIIGLFVLLLACINFMNLSTARSEKRALEVGIRKSIGSQRPQLIHQFLTESFLVVVLAFAVAIIIVNLSLDSFNQLAHKEMVFPWSEFQFWSTTLAFIVFTCLLAGSYPALYLSSFNPISVLKGTFRASKYASVPRKALVVIQFTVSVAFIIGTLVVKQQIDHAQNRPMGYNNEGLIQIPAFDPEFAGKADLIREEFVNSGAVTSMAFSSGPVTDVWAVQNGFDWEGKPEGFQESLAWTAVSHEYGKTLGLKLVNGRDFSRNRASDSLGVLINETAVKYMGLKNPIGKLLRSSAIDNQGPPLKIIGVVQDVVAQSPYEPVLPSIYFYNRYGIVNYYYLRLNPNLSASESLASVERVFNRHFPAIPFQYDFVDQEYAKKFTAELRIATLSSIFTALAILISCLGLFGLTSFVAEQRTKEIGVRKVLGATVFNVLNMLSKDFLKLVIVSCFIAIPIAYYVMNGWLQEYSYRIALKWWIFALAMLGAIGITVLTVSFQAIRAAKQNPIKSLRTE
ncbi:MAG: FtsX-like permease family protein [Bacteroidota bacterium]